MDLRTTTFPGRNLSLLAEARRLAPRAEPLRILEVGPGLAVRGFGRRTAKGTVFSGLFRRAEMVLRRLPLPDAWFENYETEEIIEAFAPTVIDLTIADINQRTLAIIARNLGGQPISTLVLDLTEEDAARRQGLAGRFDVVIALSTIGRIDRARRNAAAKTLIETAKPGGIIVENGHNLTTVGGVEITGFDSIYRRKAE